MHHTATYWVTQCLKMVSNSRFQKLEHESVELPVDELKEDFYKAGKRLFMLDYDGTLVGLQKLPQMAIPPPSTIELLRKLTNDPKNYVYIISGRDRAFLEEWFGNLRVGIAAEHGNFIRRCPPLGGEIPAWEENAKAADLSWRDAIKPIFENFRDSTPGSLVEEKEINLTWHYRGADPEFGNWQMHELVNLLHALPKSRQFDILLGSKNVEVRPPGTNKGLVVREILSKEDKVEIIIAVGDDKTDEDMFNELNNYEIDELYTATVGKKPTAAKFHLEAQPKVLALLRELSSERFQQDDLRR